MNWLKSFWKALNTPQPRDVRVFDEPSANFTPRAQQVLVLAQKEAARFNHHFIGTEHLLLGLVRLGQGTAVAVLEKMGVDLETARREVERQIGTGPDQSPLSRPVPYTPRVKKVLALAVKESRALNHTLVGTEHILLGLLREGDGVAGRMFKALGVNTEVTRQYVLRELDPNYSPTPDLAAMPQKPESEPGSETVDITRRYDVYCREGDQEVVYQNALFKRTKTLLEKGGDDVFSEYLELEQADGRTVFVAKTSVVKFAEHGVTPSSEKISGENP